jgi:rubrerythrin
MFTIRDLGDIAVQIERNGEATYREAAKLAQDPHVAEMLSQLAEDEASHAKWFENLDPAVATISDAPQLENAGRAILQGVMENRTFSLDQEGLTNSEHVEAVLAQSIVFEHDTIAFYEMLSGFIDDEKVLRHLALILEQERLHVKQLNALLMENQLSQMES